MKRDLAALADNRFDVLVIGGGIVGACLARDAARRGLAVALVEARDFAVGASEANSHFIHGGIRYLAQGQFGIVRESLRERAMWKRTAPHLVVDRPFLLPLFADQKPAKRLELRLGAMVFEAMAGNGFGRRLSRGEALACEPGLDDARLEGAIAYADCQVDLPERAVLALLADAASAGAVIANHVEASRSIVESGRFAGVEGVDRIGGGRLAIRARIAINATGPWAQTVADRLAPGQRSVRLMLSKGIHIVTPALARRHALAFSGDGEHAVVTPWGDFNMIGTTDDAFDGDLERVEATESDRSALMEKVVRFLPAARPVIENAVSAFAAVRAMPQTKGATYRASRDSLFADHREDGAQGFYTLTGGKWTTARAMAEKALDQVIAAAGMSARPCDTAQAPLGVAPGGSFEALHSLCVERLPALPPGELALWTGSYGEAAPAILSRLLSSDIVDPDAREAIRFAEAVDNEMAMTPADMARRLTRLHGLRRPGVAGRAEAWLANRQRRGQVRPGHVGEGQGREGDRHL